MFLYLWLKAWLAEQDGQDLIEYALLIGLIALVVIAAVTLGGTAIQGIWTKISTTLSGM